MTYHFDGDVAEKFGTDCATFISHMQYWIAKNAANERHFYEGRYWTYNSLSALERLFPFWTRRQIERIIRDLKKAGVLLTGHYSKNSYDRTTFYAIDESRLPIHQTVKSISPNGEMDLPDNGNDISPNGEIIKEQNNTQIEEESNKTKISKAQQVVDRYNAICTSLPRVVRLTDKRRRAVRLIYGKGHTPEQLDEVFRKAQASSFCTGQNDHHWKADFDWLLLESNLVKVLEGKYDNPAAAKPPEKGGGRKWLK